MLVLLPAPHVWEEGPGNVESASVRITAVLASEPENARSDAAQTYKN
jgi:hypothetical protein